MQFALHPHPTSNLKAIRSLNVDVQRHGARWMLRYSLFGDISKLVLPAEIESRRADNLWQSTCCELFIKSETARYYEFNFSPSTAWAAYCFEGYRSTASMLAIEAPLIKCERGASRYDLEVQLMGMPDVGPIAQCGVTAVIAESDGEKSYWALSHTAAQPDFHRADTFIAYIPST